MHLRWKPPVLKLPPEPPFLMFLAAKIAIVLALMKWKLSWIMLHKKIVCPVGQTILIWKDMDPLALILRHWTPEVYTGLMAGWDSGRGALTQFLFPCFLLFTLFFLFSFHPSLFLSYLFYFSDALSTLWLDLYPRFKVNCKVLLMMNYPRRFFLYLDGYSISVSLCSKL